MHDLFLEEQMSYETWVQIDTGVGNDKDKVKISVPVIFTVNF